MDATLVWAIWKTSAPAVIIPNSWPSYSRTLFRSLASWPVRKTTTRSDSIWAKLGISVPNATISSTTAKPVLVRTKRGKLAIV